MSGRPPVPVPAIIGHPVPRCWSSVSRPAIEGSTSTGGGRW